MAEMKDATYWRKTLQENINDPDALSRNKVELAGLVFYANEQYAQLNAEYSSFFVFNRIDKDGKSLGVDAIKALWMATVSGSKQERIKRFLDGAGAVLDAITSRLVCLHMEAKLSGNGL